MDLREIVKKYVAAGGGYGKAVTLVSFDLPPGETSSVFSQFDEDYHISRFFHFSNESGASYNINGFPQTHVSIDADIETIL